MATILAHLKVKEGSERAFEEISRDLYQASHAGEEGLLRYEYWRGSEPRTYYTLLSFTDFAAFITHQTSDHHEAASPKLGAVLEGLRLEWVDPLVDASPLLPTEAQDLSAAEDALTRLYAQRFAAQVAPWWTPLRDL
ncbi:MAG: putative quinol monooxygenase [Actinomycetota bacterium]